MGRDILIRIGLEFKKEKKHEVKNLIKKQFKGDENIEISQNDYISFYVWNWDLTEEDFKEYKKICSYVGMSEFEAIDDNCFIWEVEDGF